MSPVGPTDRLRFGLESLTPSEKRICDLMVTGKTNREIGAVLFIEEQSVKFHLTNIYRKLEVNNRYAAMLRWAPLKVATSECCGHEIYTPFCPWCGNARVIPELMEAAA